MHTRCTPVGNRRTPVAHPPETVGNRLISFCTCRKSAAYPCIIHRVPVAHPPKTVAYPLHIATYPPKTVRNRCIPLNTRRQPATEPPKTVHNPSETAAYRRKLLQTAAKTPKRASNPPTNRRALRRIPVRKGPTAAEYSSNTLSLTRRKPLLTPLLTS